MLGIIRLKSLNRLLSGGVITQFNITTCNRCQALNRQVTVGTVLVDVLIDGSGFVILLPDADNPQQVHKFPHIGSHAESNRF